MLFSTVAAVNDDATDVVRAECGLEFGQLGQISRYLATVLLGQGLDGVQIFQQAGRIVGIAEERIERSVMRVRERVVGRHPSKVTPHGLSLTTEP